MVLQRVKEAEVEVEGKITGQINQGYLLLVGFTQGDDLLTIEKVAKKISELRIFRDENDKMNKSIFDINGKILSVSQFTLYADIKKGRRPGFEKAMNYKEAENYYKLFNEELRKRNIEVEEGVFGGDMTVSLVNEGPVTIIVDSEDLV